MCLQFWPIFPGKTQRPENQPYFQESFPPPPTVTIVVKLPRCSSMKFEYNHCLQQRCKYLEHTKNNAWSHVLFRNHKVAEWNCNSLFYWVPRGKARKNNHIHLVFCSAVYSFLHGLYHLPTNISKRIKKYTCRQRHKWKDMLESVPLAKQRWTSWEGCRYRSSVDIKMKLNRNLTLFWGVIRALFFSTEVVVVMVVVVVMMFLTF